MSAIRSPSGRQPGEVSPPSWYSITSAARHLGLSRDAVLDAVRAGSLASQRDRRGVVRIAPAALIRFLAVRGAAPMALAATRCSLGNVVVLGAITPDRLPRVLAQQQAQIEAAAARNGHGGGPERRSA